jgi:hypothetical protein
MKAANGLQKMLSVDVGEMNMKPNRSIVIAAIVILAIGWLAFRRTHWETHSRRYGLVNLHRSFGRITKVTIDPGRDGQPDQILEYKWRRAPWSQNQLIVSMTGDMLMADTLWNRGIANQTNGE